MSKKRNKLKSEKQSSKQQHDPNSPAPAMVIPDVQITPACCGKSDEPQKYSFKWWKPIIETGGIIFGVILVLISCLQWREAHRQAEAAERQLAEMHAAQEIDERAWVSVQHLKFQTESNIMGGEFDLVNSGKTPGFIETIDLMILLEGTRLGTIPIQGRILAPNATDKILVMNHLDENWLGTNAILWEHSAPGRHKVAIAIQYSNIFGVQCSTKMQFSLDRVNNEGRRYSFKDSGVTDLPLTGASEMK